MGEKSMKRVLVCLIACFFIFSTLAAAEEKKITEKKAAEEKNDFKELDLADDIRKGHIFGRAENIVGPGSVFIRTGLTDTDDIMMSFGGTIRIIPTSEANWDFGISDEVPKILGGALSTSFLKNHLNESGAVNNSYIRSEDKLYFNAMPKDKKWSFFASLEYDSPISQGSVDSRGGIDSETSNFGLERLHGTAAMGDYMRFHAGWDVNHIDGFDGAGLVYGDDNPGFWITGNNEEKTLNYNLAYIKIVEGDFGGLKSTGLATLDNDKDDDRDLYFGQATWQPNGIHKIHSFYAYDRIREADSMDFLALLTKKAMGISAKKEAKTDSHHMGAYWVGTFGGLELFAEGVYQFGNSDDTGLKAAGFSPYDDFDINAYALSGDASYTFKGKITGFSFKPHLGFLYTSGDDDPNDDELGGYNGVANAQRYSARWGGENTIVGDTNFVFGSLLYGYLPEFYGNGTPVFTGGVFSNYGAGRGDNPGLSMLSAGVTLAPRVFFVYHSNINMFSWNEDFNVISLSNPGIKTPINSGYVGTEWDNEFTLALSRHHFIKAQVSFFFPGEGIEDVTSALTSLTGPDTGKEADEMASRLALEFIWHF